MGYLQNFDTTTVGTIPAGWVSDGFATVEVSAVTLHSDPNALFATPDSTSHWAYHDAPDDGGGDNTYEVWVRFDTSGQIAQFLYRLSPLAGLGFATFYGLLIQSGGGFNGLLQRSVAGSVANVAQTTSGAPNVIPPGDRLRLRVLAEGARHRCEVFLADSGLYVAPDGSTSATQQYAIDFTDTDPSAISGAGRTGVLWFLSTGTAISFDDLSTTPAGTPPAMPLTAGAAFVSGSPFGSLMG